MAITPKSLPQRMADRQAAGLEHPHPEMGSGRKFTPKSAGAISGQIMYGPRGLAIDLAEASADGGVQTQDLFLAGALRGTRLFNEG
jgi:hypothetical protein